MKINVTPRSAVDADTTRFYKDIAQQVNALSEGRLMAFYTALTAVPTTGTWNRGDFVINSQPSELGTAGSKYVIHGWQCVTAGTPGTWVQCRFLTGA
jgi:hypothetical protein